MLTRLFALLHVLLIPVSLPAADLIPGPEWDLRRDRDGIQVYTRKIAGSPFDAVLATTRVPGVTLSTLVALLQDAGSCPRWADRCVASHRVETVSETEYFVYSHYDLPFPAKDRDILAHVSWQQDRASLETTMTNTATAGILPPVSDMVRITDAEIHWRFRPVGGGAVEITNEAHIDPGSSLPGWVTNLLLVDTPWQTMQGLIRETGNPAYQDAVFEFLIEPEE